MLNCLSCRHWDRNAGKIWEDEPTFGSCDRILDNEDVAWREEIEHAQERLPEVRQWSEKDMGRQRVEFTARAPVKEDQIALTASVYYGAGLLYTQASFGCVLAEPI